MNDNVLHRFLLVLDDPLAVAAGVSLDLPIRFQPTALGAAPGMITVVSNAGAESVSVSGNAPAGKLTVTGSNFFGAVKACCTEARQPVWVQPDFRRIRFVWTLLPMTG